MALRGAPLGPDGDAVATLVDETPEPDPGDLTGR